MNVYYCEKWFAAKRQPIKPLEQALARERHDTRKSYVAVIGDRSSPAYIIDFADAWISVTFLDGLGRAYLRYDFKERQSGRLFLSMAICRQFSGDSDKVTEGTTFSFNEKGEVIIERHDVAEEKVVHSEVVADLSANWEDYPKFGNYSVLLIRDRPMPEA